MSSAIGTGASSSSQSMEALITAAQEALEEVSPTQPLSTFGLDCDIVEEDVSKHKIEESRGRNVEGSAGQVVRISA